MRRCVQNLIVVPVAPRASSPLPASDAPAGTSPPSAVKIEYSAHEITEPFSYDDRFWSMPANKKSSTWVGSKGKSYFSRVANIFSAASEELKPLPKVDEHVDSHIIRAAHMVRVCVGAVY
jgi:hypothetical protein